MKAIIRAAFSRFVFGLCLGRGDGWEVVAAAEDEEEEDDEEEEEAAG